ncbi:MAG: hypothetical protein HPY66_0722 [Firmicutes bacterium]|nr:hypothetical protein [Bacillota bacterium]
MREPFRIRSGKFEREYSSCQSKGNWCQIIYDEFLFKY